ncbi:MAG TPA: serine/threonine-protein kinase [Candidatus Brocadiia bacterium]|nr:serine/threonine-protein kinase [Candidatus Brocadiia bacterium]
MIERVGKYEVAAVLGEGGMGVVYRARDPVLARDVALKVLDAGLARDPILVRRFEEEARAIARVQHPNVMRIFAVGEDQGRRYYAMELIRGVTLASRLDERGPMPLAEAAAVFRQILRAVRQIHQAGIVHRDVKTANVMIEEGTGRAVLMDFGLAKGDYRDSFTTVGAILGTPEYMAPEQAMGGAVDARSDIYSLGAVLFEMLTGGPPFQAPDTIAVLKKQVEEAPPRVRSRRPDAPQGLEAVLSRMLAKDPAQRPASVEALEEELATAWPGAGISRPGLSAAPARAPRPSPDDVTKVAPAPPPVVTPGPKVLAAASGRATWTALPPPPRHGRDPVALGLLIFGAVAGLLGLALLAAWWLDSRRGADPSSAVSPSPQLQTPEPPAGGVDVDIEMSDGTRRTARWLHTERRVEAGRPVLYGIFLSGHDRIALRLEEPSEVTAITPKRGGTAPRTAEPRAEPPSKGGDNP